MLDTAFAMFFLIRALMIVGGGTRSPIVLFLALAGMLREVNGFREYRGESRATPKANVAIDNLMKMPEPAEGFNGPLKGCAFDVLASRGWLACVTSTV